MSEQLTSVLESARTLNEDEQISLIGALMEGMECEDSLLGPEWDAEIDRRWREFEDGKVMPVTWADVKKRLHAND